MTSPSITECGPWSNWNSCIAGRNIKQHSHFGKELRALSHKVNHTLLICPALSVFSIYPERNENICPQNTCLYITGNLIYNSKTLTQPKFSQNRWWHNHAVYLYNKILPGNKKKQATDTCNNMNKSHWHYAEGKSQMQKKHVPYDCYKICNRQKQFMVIRIKSGSACDGVGNNACKRAQENFLGWWKCIISWLRK